MKFTAHIFLLVVVGCHAAIEVPWHQFSGNGRESGVLYSTGYTVPVLDYVWHIYFDAIDARLRALLTPVCLHPLNLAAYIFMGLTYIHL